MPSVRVLVPVLALSLLAVSACGGGDEPETAASTPAATATAPQTPDAAPTDTPATPAFDGEEFTVTITGSKVAPRPSIQKVAKGTKVRITVTADADDELHVHGYDKSAALKAGEPATVEFTADVSGRFEVETHGAHLLLFTLQVS
ncbi:hypothetical protein LO762_04365 [Actinocorallia sp. API 0066]|uniref:hypothetical protein n=1 Tax=Actinocorallia sp. API 0066 TaxID=2896846 RepID=UPI001E5782D1|nr:hypothetical protein [Actinocorallia sp. API 0066]MCD0448434.1 hypothetical protein [Actinocorallia sp. API 0066]